MKYIFGLLLCTIFNSSYSQLKMIKICVGSTDREVITYLDSINNLQKNPSHKVLKTTSKDGDLQVQLFFGADNQPYYTCTALLFIFKRTEGIEICSDQIIWGDAEYALNNLNFVKDHFKKTGNNKWEYENPNTNRKVLAEYSTLEGGSKTTYILSYKDIPKVTKDIGQK